MPEFTVNLSGAFVAQFNAALASSDKRVSLGAVLLSNNAVLWSSSGGNGPAAYLTVNSNAVVPEPDAWALMILGFGAAGATLRRRRPATA